MQIYALHAACHHYLASRPLWIDLLEIRALSLLHVRVLHPSPVPGRLAESERCPHPETAAALRPGSLGSQQGWTSVVGAPEYPFKVRDPQVKTWSHAEPRQTTAEDWPSALRRVATEHSLTLIHSPFHTLRL